MANTTMDLLDYINSSDMERFSASTPKRKAQLILKNFQNYRVNQSKLAKAKTDEEKDAFAMHIERFWILANKQVKSLTDEEMSIYLATIKDRLGKVIESQNDDKMLDNKLFFGTILRQLPEEMTEGNIGAKMELREMLTSLDYSFEK